MILYEQNIDRITVHVYGLTCRLFKAHRAMCFHYDIVLVQTCFFKWNNFHASKTNGMKKGLPLCNPREKVLLFHHLDATMRVSSHKGVTKLGSKKILLKQITRSLEILKEGFDKVTDLIHGYALLLSLSRCPFLGGRNMRHPSSVYTQAEYTAKRAVKHRPLGRCVRRESMVMCRRYSTCGMPRALLVLQTFPEIYLSRSLKHRTTGAR